MTNFKGRALSSYAFNTYGVDATLYNGILDLEIQRKDLLEACIKAEDELVMALRPEDHNRAIENRGVLSMYRAAIAKAEGK